MRFSMNGFRSQLSNSVEELAESVRCVVDGEYYENEDLVGLMNQVITHSNVINCVYDDENPDFKEMSDVEIEHLKTTEG